MLEDKAPETVGKRLTKAEQDALREKYRLAIIEAIAAGDAKEAMRLRQEARRLRIKFGRKTYLDLGRRTYRPQEEDQFEEAAP